jgi:hypothetical protein
VVDFFVRSLHPMGQPQNDMPSVLGIDPLDVSKPRPGLPCRAVRDRWRPIQVETSNAWAFDPATVEYESPFD